MIIKIFTINKCEIIINTKFGINYTIVILLKLRHTQKYANMHCKCSIASHFISQYEWSNLKPRQLNGLTNIMQQHALQYTKLHTNAAPDTRSY